MIVRPTPIGTEYESIAGYRRKAASEWAGIGMVPVMIVQMDDAEATIAMVDSNLQQAHIKASEIAYAYKMKLEARLKNMGENGKPIFCSDELLAKQVGERRNQIARCIRLTNLIPKILDMVDEGKIAFAIVVELSYLKEEEQYEFYAVIDLEQCTPSLAQANRMKRLSQSEGIGIKTDEYS